MGNHDSVSPHDSASAHRSVLIKDFFSKEQWDKHWGNPLWAGSGWFLPVASTEMSTEGTALSWCYWYNSECDGRTEKAFTKWFPGMFSTSVQSMAEMYSCTGEILWRKYSFSDCTVMYLSEIDSSNILKPPCISPFQRKTESVVGISAENLGFHF